MKGQTLCDSLQEALEEVPAGRRSRWWAPEWGVGRREDGESGFNEDRVSVREGGQAEGKVVSMAAQRCERTEPS